MRILKILSLGLQLAATAALARDEAGIALPDQVRVEGRSLSLVGSGTGSKLLFKDYVAALYTERRETTAQGFIESNQTKSIQLVMLRDVDKDRILQAIREGFVRNSKAEVSALKSRLEALAGAWPDLKAGAHLVFTFTPGKGTVLSGAAKPTVIDGKDFADALFSVWLGRNPVNERLKQELLGH